MRWTNAHNYPCLKCGGIVPEADRDTTMVFTFGRAFKEPTYVVCRTCRESNPVATALWAAWLTSAFLECTLHFIGDGDDLDGCPEPEYRPIRQLLPGQDGEVDPVLLYHRLVDVAPQLTAPVSMLH